MRRGLVLALLLASSLPCWASRVVTDETGRAVTVPDHAHRIVSLVPSITDDLYSIGAGDDVVAISDYVEFPAEAKRKPSVGTITDPSLERILALHPDLVLGMPEANSQETLARLRQVGIAVFLVDPHGVAGILRTVTSVGAACGREAQAQAEVSALTHRIDAVTAAVRGEPVVPVFMPVSYDPVFTIGRGAFITEIIALAGGRSITDDIAQEWPQISLETVVARAPQALLMMRGGHMTLALLRDRPGWKTLPAVQKGKVYFVDKRVEFPSPVAIDALEDLARAFHPEPGHAPGSNP